MHCTSAYPAPPDAMNLRTNPHLAGFDVTVGSVRSHTGHARLPSPPWLGARPLIESI
jgi:sialic acid synthase SpsE